MSMQRYGQSVLLSNDMKGFQLIEGHAAQGKLFAGCNFLIGKKHILMQSLTP